MILPIPNFPIKAHFHTHILSYEHDMQLYASIYYSKIKLRTPPYSLKDFYTTLKSAKNHRLTVNRRLLRKQGAFEYPRVYILDTRLNVLFATVDSAKQSITSRMKYAVDDLYTSKNAVHYNEFDNLEPIHEILYQNFQQDSSTLFDFEQLTQNQFLYFKDSHDYSCFLLSTLEAQYFLYIYAQYNYIHLPQLFDTLWK